MKFSQKIVAAASGLLLITVVLLSIQQLSTVKQEVEALVDTSLTEMVNGVKNTIESEMESKKALALSSTEVIELAPQDRQTVKNILEIQP